MRVIIRRGGWLKSLPPAAWLGLALFGCMLIGGASVFTYYYVHYSHVIGQLLKGPVFPNASQVYAAPERLRVGEKIDASSVAAYLRSAGLAEGTTTPKGAFSMLPDGIRVTPGSDSYFAQDPAEIRFADGTISSIVSTNDQTARTEYSLEPVLITNLFDSSREKRRLVPFNDLPANLINAIISIEDRHFFQHSGLDYLRILKSAYVDLRSQRIEQGASTITQQLARGLFLSPKRTMRRKLEEALVAVQLEHRLTKQEIFEYYCNKVYLGQRAGFSISGFGEAAQAYFNKDIRDLTLPEAAFLAGIIRGPNLYSPSRNLAVATKRRNQVLQAMVETKSITPEQRDTAVATPLKVLPSYESANEAPYFVDMVKDNLLQNFSEEDLISDSYRVYTTLDAKLQQAAAEAMRLGMAEVDQRLATMRKNRRHKPTAPEPEPEQAQAAMIVLDPHTGEVKALIGGRNYGASQLNRVLARRQPGSSFKPFVYATALSAVLRDPGRQPITAETRIVDEPTTFYFEDKIYQPANYHNEYHGDVTLRYAISNSLNVPTVKIAEMAGYDNIVDLARRAGMNLQIQPTPAIALGAYEVRPLEISGAYTIFANQGVRMDPYLISSVSDPGGQILQHHDPKPIPVLDPRIAFLMTSLMQSVVDHGTGFGVRSRGFYAPAAGKTGTSHDGWFAGYTSNLLCVVWVGFDSDKELPLSGAQSALPIWTEFMKRAIALPEYSNVTAPQPPPGIAAVQIDPDSGQLATPNCPHTQYEYFLDGTQPTVECALHSFHRMPQIAGLDRIASVAPTLAAPPPPIASPGAVIAVPHSAQPESAPEPPPVEKPKKRGFFGRILGVLKGGDDDDKKDGQH